MNDPAGRWFQDIMDVNRDAFAAGHYEAAYHALMSASHLARDLRDRTRLLQVAGVADEQGRHLDEAHPAHRLSARSADLHGHPGVYHMAARQAKAHARMLEMEERKDGPNAPEPKTTSGPSPG